jgi:hypothetical protein
LRSSYRRALEVGDRGGFTSPYPLQVGCVERKLAEQALWMRERYAEWQIREFVEYNRFDNDSNGQPRGCRILNERRSEDFEVRKTPSGRIGFYCLALTISFATGAASDEKADFCFWTYLDGGPRR